MLSGLSLPHIILLLVIVVLVFGTGKLRNAGKDLGGFFKGFKDGMKGEDAPSAQQPPQQIAQQDATKANSTADKKENV